MKSGKNLTRKSVYLLILSITLLAWLLMFFNTDNPQVKSQLVNLAFITVLLIIPIMTYLNSRNSQTEIKALEAITVEDEFSLDGIAFQLKTSINLTDPNDKTVIVQLIGKNRKITIRINPDNPTEKETTIEPLEENQSAN